MIFVSELWKGLLVPFDWIRILWERFLTFWFRPMDPLPLRIFEVLLCLSMVYYFAGYLKTPELWLTNEGFHLSEKATNTSYIPPPPLAPVAWVMPIVITFYTLCAVYILGYWRRTLAWVFFAMVVYVQAMDQPTSFTINRMFIISFLFLALQPPVVVVDGKKRISGWIIRLFQATLLIQYCTAGICKMEPGDWEDKVHYILWTHSQGHYKNYISAWAVNHLPMFVFSIMGVLSLVFEFAAPVLFGWRKLRHSTVVFGIIFHLSIAVLMKDLIYFSLQMITVYILFVDPALIRRFLKRPEKEYIDEEPDQKQTKEAENQPDVYRDFLRQKNYNVASIVDRSISGFLRFALPFSVAYGVLLFIAALLANQSNVLLYDGFGGWVVISFCSLLSCGLLFAFVEAYLSRRELSFGYGLQLCIQKLPYTLPAATLLTILLMPIFWSPWGAVVPLIALLFLLPSFAMALHKEISFHRTFGESIWLMKGKIRPLIQLGLIVLAFYWLVDWFLQFTLSQTLFSFEVLRGKLKLQPEAFMPQVFFYTKFYIFSTLIFISSVVVYLDLKKDDPKAVLNDQTDLP